MFPVRVVALLMNIIFVDVTNLFGHESIQSEMSLLAKDDFAYKIEYCKDANANIFLQLFQTVFKRIL